MSRIHRLLTAATLLIIAGLRAQNPAATSEEYLLLGDATRGASLVVWAIAEGRACAAAVDAALSGQTELPAPVRPGTRPL